METEVTYIERTLSESLPLLGQDIMKADVPPELRHLPAKKLRTCLADHYGLPVQDIVVHRNKKFSAYTEGKPRISRDQIDTFARLRKKKKDKETRAWEKYVSQARKLEVKRLQKLNRELNGKARTRDQKVDPPVKMSTFCLRADRVKKHPYRRVAWKYMKWDEEKQLRFMQLCNCAEYRRILILAANVIDDLLTKSPEGFFSADALRRNPVLMMILDLPNGQLLHHGLLTCADTTYQLKRRTQRYERGPMFNYVRDLQGGCKSTNHTYHRSREALNHSVKAWAKCKGRKTYQASGLLYSVTGNRLYSLLSNANRKQIAARLRAMGITFDARYEVNIDIDAALPTLMNACAQKLSGNHLERPTTTESKAARRRTAEKFGIPLSLAKVIHAASHNGSLIKRRSSCWDGYEIDDLTKDLIALSPEIKQNRKHFRENFSIFEVADYFSFIEDRHCLSKSSQYSLLYNMLELELMKPVHRYLESQNIVFVCKHDGVDIFGRVTEQQKERIREIIGVSCSIEETKTEAKAVTETGVAPKVFKGGPMLHYNVKTWIVAQPLVVNVPVIRGHSPP